ncbi:transcriptional regulator, ArsR family [Actinacidiphila yanglinensis]|uniref:Transcriptional regulator, ArsR family n=1 Tax=Actinacidiphila yanglinensis TaxID=310779 RepID=A0A1H6A1E7_9ACTN|nr:helix-turn-helix domain-containing protein [Actinacidiphila yanglinensis]SEG42549.1 transcriptional regulator, ArsR family [Actinacidiphila yanglinensis]
MASRRANALVHPGRDELDFTTVLAALGDPVRLAIVARLAELGRNGEPACVSFALPVSKSTQSGHFRVLREAGLIRQRDEGTRRLNRLRRDDLDARFPGLLDLVAAQAPESLPEPVHRSVPPARDADPEAGSA